MTVLGADSGVLDKKLCFELWAELGTLRKTQLELARRGIKHPSGDFYTAVGISNAAHTWAVENPKESFEVMRRQLPEYTWEEHEQWLVIKATRIFYSENRFKKWLKMMGFYETQKYSDLYADRFPLIFPAGD